MKRRGLVVLVAALLAVAALTNGSSAASREVWDTRVLAKIARPGYPAFVYAHPNGRLYAATYANPLGDSMRSRVFEYSAGGTLLRSWTVPGQDLAQEHGVQAAISDASGRLLLLERSTSRVLRLDLGTGRFSTYARLADLPACPPLTTGTGCTPDLVDDPAIPNYAAWGPRGELYVSDYGQAVIWRVPPGGGKARPWYADRRLAGSGFGTAGLVYEPGRHSLLLTQQSSGGLGELSVTTGKLYRLHLRDDGRPGSMAKVWESRPGDLPDGFGIARSGHLYVALAGLANQLVELDADGTELARFPKAPLTGDNGSAIPFDTPSSATFSGDRVIVANQSFFGDRSHMALLDVYVGEPGRRIFIPAHAGGPA